MNFLNELNIKTINKGVSSGHKWMGSKGPLIESFSPVDGKLIGSVKSAIMTVTSW
jgi:aldehyde dehydrogenase (NAD+)